MKVTKELKDLIARQFAVKIDDAIKEIEAVARKQYEDKLEELTNMPEWKAFVDAANAFRAKYETTIYADGYKSPYCTMYPNNLAETNPLRIISYNSSYVRYDSELSKQIADKRTELELQKESLLIKLAYEKDLAVITAMLAEFGITL